MRHLLSLLPLTLMIVTIGLARQATTPSHAAPIEKFVNPDGTLNLDAGYSGSLDMGGWGMVADGPGAPRFTSQNVDQPERGSAGIQSSAGDEFWDGQFAVPGANNYVLALAMYGGSLYIGGQFTEVGGMTAHYIARWDGSSWSEVGGGMDCYVNALVVIGTDLYAGGCFGVAGGVGANRIARWDGSNWHALGSGVNVTVNCLATDGTNLYAGGYFTIAGGASANYIAKWDGSSWTSLGSGMNSSVSVILTSGSDVYAGGYFTTAGGNSAHNIAKWDGATWTGLGLGMNAPVLGLTMVGSDLYAGGGFTQAGLVSALRVARWDGSNWFAMGGGSINTVFSLAKIGSDVYMGSQGDVSKWNGSSWSTVGGGISGAVVGTTSALVVLTDGSDVYAGGSFTTAGTASCSAIARWNGSAWSAVGSGNGIGSTVRAIATIGTDVYVGGDFTAALGLGGVNHIVRWNGTSASTLGSGINGQVNALAANGGAVYAAGGFSNAGGSPANSIARWNGSAWSALGTGLNNTAYAVAVNGSDVYAGGYFTTAGGGSAVYVARWDGSAWSALGSGMNDTVFALTYAGGYLYAGGAFTMAGGVSAYHLARWDGSSWSAVDTMQIPVVRALATVGNDVYVGGENLLYRWDGANWTSFSLSARAIATNGTDRYAAGYTVGHLNGSSYSMLGSGITGTVHAIALAPDGSGGHDLYVGGSFTKAGGKSSKNFARWNGPAFNVAPSGLAFGQVHVGLSPVDSVTVRNTGSHALEISSVDFYYGEFTASPTSATIAPGDSQRFHITYTPNSAAAINSFALFADNMSPGRNPLRISGTGGTPIFSMTPSVIAFGTTHPNTSKQDSVFIINDGTETLEVTSAVSSHPDLVITPLSAFIAPSDTQVFHLDFSPSAEYFTRVDTISFFSNYPVSPIKLITLADNWVYLADTVQDGWNLVSVPFSVQDYRFTSIFTSGAPSTAFAYEGHYRSEDTLKKGPGYWMKFSGDQVEYLAGAYSDRETVTVAKGWNIVGSHSFPIPVESIASFPGGIVTTNFFGYNNGYSVADSIRPGHGYWVKCDQDGMLIYSAPAVAASSSAKNFIHIVPTPELPPVPPDSPSADASPDVPAQFALEQNFPNPFNPSTVIRYRLPADSYVTLRIYDVLGRIVETLVDGEQGAGHRSVVWNAASVPSGVYYYEVHAGGLSETKKMLLMK